MKTPIASLTLAAASMTACICAIYALSIGSTPVATALFLSASATGLGSRFLAVRD